MLSQVRIPISNIISYTPKPIVIYLQKDYMGVSHIMRPILRDMAADFAQEIDLYLLESGSDTNFENQLAVAKYPILLFYRKGHLVAKEYGCINREGFKQAITNFLNQQLPIIQYKNQDMYKIKQYEKNIPTLSTEQMIEVDRLMIEEYHIELIQMMENAGRCLAILANQRFLKKKLKKKTVIVLAGTGGNGGGALVCARRLHNMGVKVSVFLTATPDRFKGVPAHQLDILQRMGISIFSGEELSKIKKTDLIIDGIIGYSISGDPYGVPAQMINWVNEQTYPVLALDTPSGLNLTTGHIASPTVKATATLTLALPKQGLFKEEVLPYRGNLYLGDISVPPTLYAAQSIGLKVSPSIFAKSDVVGIDVEKKKKKVDSTPTQETLPASNSDAK